MDAETRMWLSAVANLDDEQITNAKHEKHEKRDARRAERKAAREERRGFHNRIRVRQG